MLLRPGTCKVGGRNSSGSDEEVSSSNKPRREEGNL